MADTSGLYKKAEEAFNKRNYQYAEQLFLQLISTDPNHSEGRKGLRATVLARFKEQGAPSKFSLTLRQGKVMAEMMVAKNNAQKRMDIAQKYLIEDPNNDKVRAQLADALLQLGHAEGALAEAEMAKDTNPKNGEAWKLMGRAQLERGQAQEAKASLETAQKLKPDDREVGKLLRDQAASATMKKGFEENKSYREMIKDKDKAADLEHAQHLIKSDEDAERLLQKLTEEFEANPTDAKLAKKIGDVWFENKKDLKTAKGWYEKAVVLNPYDSTLKDKVEDMDIRAYDPAIEKAQQAGDEAKLKELRVARLRLELAAWERRKADRPTDMGVRFELAKRFFSLGKIQEAIAEFQQSVKDPKKKVESHVYLGLCFQKKKVYDMAEQQFTSAEQSAIAQDKKMSIWYYSMLCYEESGKRDKALAEGKKIMEIDYAYKDVAQRVDRYQASSGASS